jgi:hypothetical protein
MSVRVRFSVGFISGEEFSAEQFAPYCRQNYEGAALGTPFLQRVGKILLAWFSFPRSGTSDIYNQIISKLPQSHETIYLINKFRERRNASGVI